MQTKKITEKTRRGYIQPWKFFQAKRKLKKPRQHLRLSCTGIVTAIRSWILTSTFNVNKRNANGFADCGASSFWTKHVCFYLKYSIQSRM